MGNNLGGTDLDMGFLESCPKWDFILRALSDTTWSSSRTSLLSYRRDGYYLRGRRRRLLCRLSANRCDNGVGGGQCNGVVGGSYDHDVVDSLSVSETRRGNDDDDATGNGKTLGTDTCVWTTKRTAAECARLVRRTADEWTQNNTRATMGNPLRATAAVCDTVRGAAAEGGERDVTVRRGAGVRLALAQCRRRTYVHGCRET